jgi:hypothetical protein
LLSWAEEEGEEKISARPAAQKEGEGEKEQPTIVEMSHRKKNKCRDWHQEEFRNYIFISKIGETPQTTPLEGRDGRFAVYLRR